MNIVWNKVTWYSRLLAVIFFIIVMPILTFYVGTVYEDTKISLETTAFNVVAPQSTVSTLADVTDTPAAAAQSVSGISGAIHAKPCLDTDPACADLGITLVVKSDKGIVTQTNVPMNGKFVLFLDPGTYTLTPSANSLPFQPQTVIVQGGNVASVTLSYVQTN